MCADFLVELSETLCLNAAEQATGAACVATSGCVDDSLVRRRIQLNRNKEENPVHNNEKKISNWGDKVI